LRRVRAVRGAIGPDIKLRIDANEGWSMAGATWALKRMEPYHIELVEQPLARWDLRGAALLRQRTTIPIAADEGVRDARDAARSIEAGAVDIINIKLMKSGGLHPAREIVALARTHGIQLMVGGMVGESSLAVAAAASLASAFNFEYADLDADLLLADSLSETDCLPLEQSQRHPQARPGFGLGRTRSEFLTPL
jgi:L-alanine-DL-glutamate epimerase-like enolase superfamily enzyme